MDVISLFISVFIIMTLVAAMGYWFRGQMDKYK